MKAFRIEIIQYKFQNIIMNLDDDRTPMSEKHFEFKYWNYLRIDKKIKIAEAEIREKVGMCASKRQGLYRI